MPVYEYECMDCGCVVEVVQKMSDTPLEICDACSGKLNKLISQGSFHLKGSGWYVTDYKNRPEEKNDSPIENTPAGADKGSGE